MLIFNSSENQSKLRYSDLKYLTWQLGKLLECYSRNVYIEDPEHKETIYMLQNIHNKLVAGEYQYLLTDLSVIDWYS